MKLSRSSALSSALLILLAPTSQASPINSYPLSIQFPPLIQYGKAYSYQLPSDTFTSSDNTELSYNATGLPSWLAFDSTTRTFSGNAPSSPTDSSQTSRIWFDLNAIDGSGELSVNSSLAITSIDVATISNTSLLTSELQDSGNLSNSDTLILTPGQQFTILLSRDLFNSSATDPIIQYYAMLSSHSPLPIWVSFDSNLFTFSGTAPAVNSDIAPSVIYSLSLLAIQISDFSSVSLDFDLQVGAHQFFTNVTSVTETVKSGENFTYTLPLDDMTLDGSTMQLSSISAIDTNSSWLSTDLSSGSISGTVPDNFETATYSLNITNTYSDSVTIDLHLSANESTNTTENGTVFSESSLPAINATTGNYFSYTLPQSAFNSDSSANLSSSYEPSAPWLTFHESNLTFNGNVPSSFSGTTITIINENDDQDKLILTVRAVETPVSSSTPSSTSSSVPSSASSSAQSSNNSSGGVSKRTIAIICGVVIPVVVILAILLLFLCCRRRKQVHGPISKPILPETEIKGVNDHDTSQTSETLPPNFTNGPYSSSTEKLHDSFTPTAYSNSDGGFNSPGRATEFNMYKLDNPKPYLDVQPSPISFFSEGGSETTHVGDEKLEGVQRNILADLENGPPAISSSRASPAATGTALGVDHSSGVLPSLSSLHNSTPAIPPKAAIRHAHGQEVPFTQGTALNSWRQTSQPSKRWHAREQGGSLAKIPQDELPSIRMVNDDERNQSTFNSITRENSSPILQPLSDYSDSSTYSKSDYTTRNAAGHANSGSIGSYSSSDSETMQSHYGPAVPYATASNLGAIVESPNFGGPSATFNAVTPTIQGSKYVPEPLESSDELYRTASSGEEYMDAESSEDGEIQPYLNSKGEWEWEEVPGPPLRRPIVYGQAIDSPDRTSSVYSGDGGDARTITSVSGSGMGSISTVDARKLSGPSNPALHRKSSTKLVLFTKERSASLSTPGVPTHHPGNLKMKGSGEFHSESAELSFV